MTILVFAFLFHKEAMPWLKKDTFSKHVAIVPLLLPLTPQILFKVKESIILLTILHF